MYLIVSYDVSTKSSAGERRLRRVAAACESRGQRVQYSVFECKLDHAQWVAFRRQLLDILDLREDSLRVYYLGDNWRGKVEHHGAKPVLDIEGPLIG